MTPKPLHPSKIKPLPPSVGIYEGRGGAEEESAYADTWQAHIDIAAEKFRALGRAILEAFKLR